MNNPTKKTQKPRTGAGSLQRKRDRFTQKMNQIHGVRGYASMREAMDAKYGYIPENELQSRVARLTNHLIERYSHYTVDEVRSVAAQAAIDPNHPLLQKYWDEIDAESSSGSLTSVGVDASLLPCDGDGSESPGELKESAGQYDRIAGSDSKEIVESQTTDSDVGTDDAVCQAPAEYAGEGVIEAEVTTSIVVDAAGPDDNSLVPSKFSINDDGSSVSSSDSYMSAIDVDVPMLVCAEVHQIDVDLASVVQSDASPLASGRDAFPRSHIPIRPPRAKRLAPQTVGEVKVSVANVLACDIMRRVAGVSGDAFAVDPFPILDPSSRVRNPNLYGRESCLQQGVLRWCVAIAAIVMVTTGGLCSLL